jgi:hypothetical protein
MGWVGYFTHYEVKYVIFSVLELRHSAGNTCKSRKIPRGTGQIPREIPRDSKACGIAIPTHVTLVLRPKKNF